MSFVLIDDAKVRRVLPDSKYSGEIFSELLRQGGKETTKLAQGAKSCREQRILPNYFVVSKEIVYNRAKCLQVSNLLATFADEKQNLGNGSCIKQKKMNTLIVVGSVLLIAIGGTLFFKYQDKKMAKE